MSWQLNPDSPSTIPNDETKRNSMLDHLDNLIQNEKDHFEQECRPLIINLWNKKLQEQDIKWRIRCENDPVVLDPHCVDFFRQVKKEMDDDELFNLRFEDQKRNEKYEFHDIYRRLNL